MNFSFVYDVPGWAYYFQAQAMKKYWPKKNDNIFITNYRPTIDDEFFNKDLIFQMEFPRAIKFSSILDPKKTTLVAYFSVGYGNHMDYLKRLTKCCKHVLINNYECYHKYGDFDNTHYISNGVDFDIFNYKKDISKRKPKVIWTGSTKYHKCKNYDTILLPLKEKLEKSGIDVEFNSTTLTGIIKTQNELCDWYNDATVYCCASSTEGTPNPALEAASCGCTVVSTRVGNMPELIKDGWNGYLCDIDVDDLYDKCMKAIDNVQLNYNMQKEIKKWDWKRKVIEYYNYFIKAIQQDRR